ncbi:Neuropeptides capa receptor [Strongyloides ratti]|uniref:Neuropeptides capa receptor n=1 Tax=Strongyloides ratti TaxID=34506 RepID=A0A090LJ02_STRRB|nr:Neuropeptides capa receptor [Strongyloides ratti]CEF69787.1 Neuropeptides capa receptor [Strongyloides ratti]
MCSRMPDVKLLVRSQQFMNDFRLAGMDGHYVINSTGHNVSAYSLGIEELEKYCYDEKVANFAHLLKIAANTLGSSQNCIENVDQELSKSTIFYIQITLSFIFLAVCIIGSIGNLLTVLVINKTKSLHNQTNYFLASLACSDFLLILVGVPFDLISIWHPRRHLNISYYCEITSTSISLFTFASILVIVSLTVERFLAICYPFSLRSIFDKRMALNVIYGTWIIALIPSIYIGMQFKIVSKDFCGFNREIEFFTDYNVQRLENETNTTLHDDGISKYRENIFGTCDFVRNDNSIINKYTFEIMLVVTFVIPVLFIVYCYVRILQTLSNISSYHVPISAKTSIISNGNFNESNGPKFNQSNQVVSNKNLDQIPINNGRKNIMTQKDSTVTVSTQLLTIHSGTDRILSNQRAQKVVMKMLITVTAVFFLCYLPYHIERLIVIHGKDFCDNSIWCRLLYPITGLLQYVSAMLNPFIYNLMSVRFRNGFRTIVRNIFGRVKGKQFKKKSCTGDELKGQKRKKLDI